MSRRHTRGRRGLVLAVALTVVTTACAASGGSDGAERPTTTRAPSESVLPPATTPPGDHGGSDTTTTVAPPAPEPIEWSSCDGGFECGEVEVPVDYADPSGPTLTLGLVRRAATDPDQRIGSLFVNPGGPGGSATEFAEMLPLPRSLTQHFDVIGVDPRGVGRSTPLDCHRHLQEIYDADPSPETAAERQSFIDISQEFVDDCAQTSPDLLPHLGTVEVARDLDQVRAALGEDQITYLGYSYGTSIGQQYARLFPDRVRAMVLDGVVDTNPTGLESAAGQAAGFQGTLDAYVEACDERDCLDGPARQAIDDLLATAEAEPIAAKTAGRPASPGVVNLAIGQALRSPALWPSLTSAVRQAQKGNGDGLVHLADDYLGRDGDGYDLGFEIYFAVSCLDQSWPSDPQKILDAADRVGKQYPELGAGIVSDYVRCALWPTPPQPLEPIPADIRGLPPVVLVSTTGDPATPHEGGVRVAESIPGAVLITNHGDQHTIVAQGKSCIDDPVTAYLVDLEVPAPGIECD